MVTSNQSWEIETKRYLRELQGDLADINGQLEELQKKRDALVREVEAFTTALEVHLRKTGRHEIIQQDLREILINQPNHKERIKRIAEQNNGLLKIGAAADFLYNLQIMKARSRMVAYRIIYGLVVEMTEQGIFQKSGPGEFRLVGAQPQLPVN